MAPQPNHFGIDLEDEVVRGSIVTQNGKVIPKVPRPLPTPPPTPTTTTKTLGQTPQAVTSAAKEATTVAVTPWQKTTREVTAVTAGMGTILALGKATGPIFMGNVFTFALAGLIGYRVVWGVAPALHSPLMSVTNAISGNDPLLVMYCCC